MSIKLYRIEARYFVPEVSTPWRIRVFWSGSMRVQTFRPSTKLHRKPPHDGVGWLTKLLPESAAGAFVDAAEADKPKVSFVTAVVDFVSGTFQPIIPALS